MRLGLESFAGKPRASCLERFCEGVGRMGKSEKGTRVVCLALFVHIVLMIKW